MPSVFFRPGSDVSTDGWSASSGGNLSGMLNEAVANDSDYVNAFPEGAGNRGATRTLTMQMAGTAPIGTITGAKIRVRTTATSYFGSYSYGTGQYLKVFLDGVDYGNLPVSPPIITTEITLTAQAAASLNLTNLQVAFTNSFSGVANSSAKITWMELEIMYDLPAADGIPPSFLAIL